MCTTQVREEIEQATKRLQALRAEEKWAQRMKAQIKYELHVLQERWTLWDEAKAMFRTIKRIIAALVAEILFSVLPTSFQSSTPNSVTVTDRSEEAFDEISHNRVFVMVCLWATVLFPIADTISDLEVTVGWSTSDSSDDRFFGRVSIAILFISVIPGAIWYVSHANPQFYPPANNYPRFITRWGLLGAGMRKWNGELAHRKARHTILRQANFIGWRACSYP